MCGPVDDGESGDADETTGDGKLTIADVKRMAELVRSRVLVGGPTPEITCTAEREIRFIMVNLNGTISSIPQA